MRCPYYPCPMSEGRSHLCVKPTYWGCALYRIKSEMRRRQRGM